MTKSIPVKLFRTTPLWASILTISTGHFLSLAAEAQSARPGSSQPFHANTAAGANTSASRDFNLAATVPIVTATKSGTIQVGGTLGPNGVISGGTPLNILMGQVLTPAMNAALWQSSGAGSQHLQLNSSGAAVGGFATINSSWASNLSSLVVPKGVSVNAINYTTANPLNVLNSSDISGSFYALQTQPSMTASLNFNGDLHLGAGALLTSNLPANANLPGLFSSQNLVLNVAGNLNNQGTVSVAGMLTATVGGTINNVSVANSPAATISAQNINLLSGSGSIINSGLISALNTLNIGTIDPSVDLRISNAGGVLEAVGSRNSVSGLLEGGVLNIRSDGANLESANVQIMDGQLHASEINAFGRNVNIFTDRIDGRINIKGSAAHIGIGEGNLVLGDQVLSGDPTYSNINGNIVIDGTFTTSAANPDLAIIAGGNITDTNSGLPFGLSSTNGGSVLIVAGAASITNNLVNDTTTNLGFSTTANATTGGGSILFSGMLKNGINTTSAGAGGSVTLVALQGSSPTSGRIDLQSGGINTSGTGLNNNGNITILAGALSGSTAIQNIGPITAAGPGTGSVLIAAASPTPTSITVKNGAITGGSITLGKLTGGAVNLSSDINSSGTLLIESNGAVSVANIGLTRTPSNVQLFSYGSTVSAGAVNSTGDLSIGTIVSTGITLSGNLNGTSSVSIATASGGITASSASIISSGTVIVNADSGDVVIGDINNASSTSLAPVNVVASTGKTTVGSIHSAGGAVLIGNSFTDTAGVVLNGIIDNRKGGAGGAVTIGTKTGGISGSGQNIFTDGAVVLIALSSTNSGDVSIGKISNATGKNADVLVSAASGGVSVGPIESSGGVKVGELNTTGITLTGDIHTSGNSGVTVSTSTGGVVGDGRGIFSNGPVVVVATSPLNSGTVSIGAIDNSLGNGDVLVSSVSGKVIASGIMSTGQIKVGENTSSGIKLTGDLSTIGTGGVRIITGTGGISAAKASITAPSSVTIQATSSSNSGAVSIGAVSAVGVPGGVFVTSESGTISVGAITTSDSVNVGSANSKGITLNGDINSGGSSGVLLRTATGGIAGTTSNIIAIGPVTVAAEAKNNSGSVSIGNINNLSGSGDVFVISQSGSVLSGGVSSNGSVTVGSSTSRGITLTGDIQSNGSSGVQVVTGTGGIAASGKSITAQGMIGVNAVDKFSSGSISVGSISNIGGTGDIFITAQSGAVSVAGVQTQGNVQIGSSTGTGVTISGNIESNGGGGVNIRTGTGGISAFGSNVKAFAGINVSAEDNNNSGTISIGALSNLGGSGNISVRSETGAIISGGVFAVGNVAIGSPTGTGVTLSGNIESHGAGGVSVRTATGGITAASCNITASGFIALTAEDPSQSGSISVGNLNNLSGNNNIFVRAETGSISIGGAQSGGNLTLGGSNGSGVTITGNLDSHGSAGINISTRSGGISAQGVQVTALGDISMFALDLNNSGSISTGFLSTLGSSGNIHVVAQSGQVKSAGILTDGNVSLGASVFNTNVTGIILSGNIESHGSAGVSILTNTGGIAASGRTISALGPVFLQAADANNSGAISIGKIVSSGTVTIDAQSGAINSGGAVSTGAVSIGSKNTTSITLAGDINSNDAVTLIAAGGINTAGTAIKAGAKFNAFPIAGTISLGKVEAVGGVIIGDSKGNGTGVVLLGDISSSGSGDVSIQTATGGIDGSKASISSGGAVLLYASDLFNSGKVAIAAVSSVMDTVVDSRSGSVLVGSVSSAGKISIGNELGATGVSLVGALSSGDTIKIRTVTGGIEGTAASITSAQDVSVFAVSQTSSGAVKFGNLSGIVGSLLVDSASGTVSVGTIQTSGSISIGNELGATGIILNGDIKTTGSSSVQIGTLTGGISGASANIFAPSFLARASDTLNSGAIQIGSINASLNGVVIDSLSGTVSTGKISSLGTVNIGNSTSAHGITLNGDINASGTGSVIIETFDGGIAGGKSNITAGGAVSLTANATANSGAVSIASINTTGASSSVSLGSKSGTVSTGAVSTKGSVSIGTPTGKGVLVNGDINSGSLGVAIYTQTGGVDASNSTISSGSIVDILAGDSFNSGAVKVGPIISSSNISVDSSSGSIALAGVTGSNSITIGNQSAAKGITLSGTVSNASGDISISTASGGISGSGDVLAFGKLNIAAAASAVSLSGLLSSQTDNIAVSGKAVFGLDAISLTNISAAGSIGLTATGGGNIKINAQSVSAGSSATLIASGNASITFNGGSFATVGPLTFTANAVNIGAFSTVSSGTGPIVINADKITIGQSATVIAPIINFKGQTFNGTIAANTNMLVSNSGTVQSTNGDITIAAELGQDLKITGNGSGKFIAPSSTNINISTTAVTAPGPNILLGPGNQEFIVGDGLSPGASVNFFAGAITISPGVNYVFTNDFTNVSLNTSTLNGNPAQFVIHPNGGNPNSKISVASTGGGTIANSAGPVNLGFLDLSFNGPLAIISSTDIISNGPLTISISGTGGDISLIAGFDFAPTTTGQEGPDSTLRFTTGISAGGSINLSNVNITTNSFGAGNILAIAAKGSTVGSGSISLGNLSSGGTQGVGGNVRLLGSNITVNSIDTRGPGGAGSVDVQSVNSVSGSATIVSGLVIGGFFPSGAQSGTVSISNINAGNSNVLLRGATVVSDGVISANKLEVRASSTVGPLSTQLSNLSLTTGGAATINNVGNLSLAASLTNGLTLLNAGNFTLAGKLNNLSSDVNITLSSGTFSNAGNTITASGNSVNIIADSINLTGSSSIQSFNARLQPFTSSLPVTIGAVGQGLLISTAAISGIAAPHIFIGSKTSVGGITLSAPLALTNFTDLNFVQGAVNGTAFAQNAPITLSGANSSFSATADSGKLSIGSITNTTGLVSLVTNGVSSDLVLNNGIPLANNINLIAGTGKITGLPQSTVISAVRDASGNGGRIGIQASNLASQNLNFDLSGNSTGNGGTLFYINTSTSPANLSSSNLQVNVAGINAGSIIVNSGGNLTVNTAGMFNSIATGSGSGKGNGANFAFTAGVSGTGNLLVIGNLSANGVGTSGRGGSILFSSNSATAFNLGSTATSNTNGIKGTISLFGSGAADGSLSVSNRGGGIIDSTQAFSAVSNLTFDTTGASNGTITITKPIGSALTDTVTLTAGGTGSILPGSIVLTGTTVNLKSNSGAITANVNTASLSANTGGAAAVSVTNQRAGTLILNASSAGGNITVKNTAANSGISLEGSVISTNTTSSVITLTATGSGAITDAAASGPDFIQGGTIKLSTGAGSAGIGSGTAKANALRVKANNISLTSPGVMNIDNLGLNGGLLTISAANPSSSFSLRSATPVKITPALTNAKAVLVDTSTGIGGISFSGNIGSNKTETVDLTTSLGDITGTGTIYANNSGTGIRLTTDSGRIGSSTAAVKTNSPILSVLSNNSGLINLSDAFTGGISVNSSLISPTGAVTFVGSSSTLFAGDINAAAGTTIKTTAGGATFAGNILGAQVTITTAGNTNFAASKNVNATNGAITVTESAGLLNIGAGAIFSASSSGPTAKITLLEKSNVASAGITIGDGTKLFTSAGGVKGGSGGQITVVVGASIPAKAPGTQPGNVFVDLTKASNPSVNKVYWGTNSSKILTPGSNVNNLAIVGDTAIQFSAGSVAPITLAGNTQITADPPTGISASALLIPHVSANSRATSNPGSHPAILSFAGSTPVLLSKSAIPANASSLSGTALLQGLTVGESRTVVNPNQSVLLSPAVAIRSAMSITGTDSISPNSANVGMVDAADAMSAVGTADNNNMACSTMINAENPMDSSIKFNTANPRALDGSVSKVDKSLAARKLLTMNQGSAVFAPSNATRVETPFGQIDIDAGSLAMIFVTDTSVGVFNLDDLHRDAVRIFTGEHKISLAPGHHVSISQSDAQSFEQVNPAAEIAYRKIKQTELAPGRKAFSAEFSVPSAISAMSPLKLLLNSKTPQGLKLRSHLLKTYAALSQMKSSKERFQQYSRSKVTACARL